MILLQKLNKSDLSKAETSTETPLNDDSRADSLTNVPFLVGSVLEKTSSSNKKRLRSNSKPKSSKNEQKEREDRIIKEFYGLICEKCEETPSFEKLTQLRDHMRSIHSIKVTTIECCSKILKKRCQLLDHAKIHVNPHELRCQECGKQCLNRYRLKVHVIQHHASDDGKNFSCEKCDKKFYNSGNLRAHMKVHLSKEEKDALKTHICDICNGGFMSKSLLAHHIRQIHQNLYTCVCDICAKSFKTKMHFLSHYKHVHTNPDQIRVQCQIFGKWIANESSLKKHVRLNHEDPGPHVCKECGKVAPTKNALISHERYMHKSANKFKCQFCIKCFKKPIHLKEHLTTHLGGVLYRCDFCEKTFNSGANYFKHRKQKHAEELAKKA